MLKIAWWVFIYGSFPIKFLTFNSLGPRTCKTVICIPFHHRQRCEDNFRFWFPRRVYESALRILCCNYSCFTWWKVPSWAEWLVGQSLCLVVVTRLIINVGSPKNAFLALKLCVVSLYMPFNVIYHIWVPALYRYDDWSCLLVIHGGHSWLYWGWKTCRLYNLFSRYHDYSCW